jgi:cell division septum initiation protein DivIVA
MTREEIESRLGDFEREELRLRRRIEELQDVVQNAPGSHSPGVPPAEILKAEREIQTLVLALSDLDRKRQELTVAMSLA